MQCDHGIISGTGSTSFLPIPPTKPTCFFPNQLPFANQFPTRIHLGSGSLKVKASIYAGPGKPTSEMSFYELLGIPETVTLPEIKRAYKQLARKYHPDVSPPDCVEEYTERFIRVQEAYETLSDPRTRALYDTDLARGLHLAFSARKRTNQFDQEMEDKSLWRSRWQDQLSGLKRRSMYKDAGKNMSWGARMRQQRSESSPES